MASGLHADKELSHEIDRLRVSEDSSNGKKRRQDITNTMFAATKALAIGQVVRAPDFSFLDALGALEIMDPKTDSGMTLEGDDEKDVSELQSLLPEEVIWIMDQLLAREISWHSGNPLAQTLFMCTFLVNSLLNFKGSLESATFLKRLPSLEPSFEANLLAVVLRAYILAVIKCTDNVRRELQKGNIYEEEDVATNSASLGLLENIDLSDFTKLLQEAHEIVEAEAAKNKTGQILHAITSRLQFRQKFLEVVSMSASSSKARVEDIKQCLDLLPKITETMSLGKEIPLAFSTRIQRRLSIQVPPRPMVSVDPRETAAAMKTMLENLIEIESLYNYKSPNELVNFFECFAAREPTPYAYVRSMLQSRFNNGDVILLKDDADTFLKRSLIDVCHPQAEYFIDKGTQSQHPINPKFKIQKYIEDFYQRVTPMYMDLFRIKCHNKSRQRRNLSNIVQEWEAIQLDIEKIDVELLELIPQQYRRDGDEEGPKHAFPLCSWVYHVKLTVIETVLLMGLELDIYQPYEYVLIYGYLGHTYLMHTQQLDRIKLHVNISKKRKSEALYVDFLIIRNAAMENLCKAYCAVETLLNTSYSQVFMVLRALELIRLPTRDKTTDYMRYTLRLKPFWGISSPEILPFEGYTSMFTIPKDTRIMVPVLQRALENASIARQAIDGLLKMDIEQTRMRFCFSEFQEDIKNLKKSCIGISIFIQGLVKQVAEGTDVHAGKTVIMERKYHPRFGLVKLLDSQKPRSRTLDN